MRASARRDPAGGRPTVAGPMKRTRSAWLTMVTRATTGSGVRVDHRHAREREEKPTRGFAGSPSSCHRSAR